MEDFNTILLVEDNPKDVELTIAALEQNNLVARIKVLNDGVDALEYLKCEGNYKNRNNGRPAFILLDIKMPRMDGIEFLKIINDDYELKTIPIVILTSSREEKDLVESYKLGVNAYVVKPVNFSDFITAVKQIGIFWATINELPPKGSMKYEKQN